MILASPLLHDGEHYSTSISHSTLKDVIPDATFFQLPRSNFDTYFDAFLVSRTAAQNGKRYQPDKMQANRAELKRLSDHRYNYIGTYFNWVAEEFYSQLLLNSPFQRFDNRTSIFVEPTTQGYLYNAYARGFLINIKTIIIDCPTGYNLSKVKIIINGVLLFDIYPGERLTLPLNGFERIDILSGVLDFTVTTKIMGFSRQNLPIKKQAFTGTVLDNLSSNLDGATDFMISQTFKANIILNQPAYTVLMHAANTYIDLHVTALNPPLNALDDNFDFDLVGYSAVISLPGQTFDFGGFLPTQIENNLKSVTLLNPSQPGGYLVVYTPLPVYNGVARNLSKINYHFKKRF